MSAPFLFTGTLQQALEAATAACCCGGSGSGSGSGSGVPLISCFKFACLHLGSTEDYIFTTVTGCSLGTPTYGAGGFNMTGSTGCDDICVEDPSNDWKFDSHDVTMQSGCQLGAGGAGNNDVEDWTGGGTAPCNAFLWAALCCIDRDDGTSYIAMFAVLGTGNGTSFYSFKSRALSLTHDGTYTYISASNITPFESFIGASPCCTTPNLTITFRMKVDNVATC